MKAITLLLPVLAAAFAGCSFETESPGEPVLGPFLTAAEKARNQEVYAKACAACHQAHGMGSAATAPSLVGTAIVVGDTTRLTRIVLQGLMGPMEVEGRPFSGVMPPQGMMLSDGEIAAALTHARTSWGNRATPISEGEVARIRASTTRKRLWTWAELNAAESK